MATWTPVETDRKYGKEYRYKDTPYSVFRRDLYRDWQVFYEREPDVSLVTFPTRWLAGEAIDNLMKGEKA